MPIGITARRCDVAQAQFKSGDVVPAVDDGQRFRVETVLDYDELLVEALDGETAGESGIVLGRDVRLVERHA